MTRPAVPATRDEPDAGAPQPIGSGIGRAAALIAALTVAARLLGLARTMVFAKTVGATCLGTAYVTANTLPNVVYDIVVGGALTAVMVPVLAGPAERSAADQAAAAEVRQTSTALLTWTALILVPVSAAVAAAAGPLARLLNPVNAAARCAQAPLVAVTSHLLVAFAPQILLYGLAVVLYGILQAHRRFGAPALAPVISSLVVIASYLAFVPLGARDTGDLAALPLPAELMLAVGTTAGVAALAVTALVPAWRLRTRAAGSTVAASTVSASTVSASTVSASTVRPRPTLRFPAGVGRRAGGLAVFGIVALAAQDLSQIVVIVLANGHGSSAAVVLYQYGWQVFEAAYAVLAISIAVSAFPLLSVREGAAFDETAAGSVRAVLLMSFLGAALVVAVAIPAAHFLASSHGQVGQLATGLALLAPGLAGYGLVASLSRVLLAARRIRAATTAVAAGWLIVIAADVALVLATPGRAAVAMLALGNTIGLTVAGVALVAAVLRARGPAALAGAGRAALTGLAAAAAAAVAGGGSAAAVEAALPAAGPAAQVLIGALGTILALAAFALVALVLDGGELRAAVIRVWRSVLR